MRHETALCVSLSIHSACVFMNAIDQCMSVICCGCCSSLFLQQLKPVLCIVRCTVSSVNGLTVVCEKHQVLRTKQTHTYKPLTPDNKNLMAEKTKIVQMLSGFLPGNKFWWWWCTSSGFCVSASPSCNAVCTPGLDGSAPRRESHGAWSWCKRSGKIKLQT